MSTSGAAYKTDAGRQSAPREATQRRAELERRLKETAGHYAPEQARLAVEADESRVEVLLSVHRECSEPVDWLGLSAMLPLPTPARHSYHELRAQRQLLTSSGDSTSVVRQARAQDDRDHQDAVGAHAKEQARIDQLRTLALRVMARDEGS